MVQLVYLSSKQDVSLTGLAAGMARQMESGAREFIRGINTEKGSITFQKLSTGVVRALIIVKGSSSGYPCVIGTKLSGISVWANNYVGAKMFGKIGSIDGFDVFVQEFAPAANGNPEIFSASVSANSASCAVSVKTFLPVVNGPEYYNTLFIMDGIVRFIQPSLVFPYQSTLPIHVPSFGRYMASFYQSALEPAAKVRTFLQYPVKLADPEGGESEKYELRNLELQFGYMQTYSSANFPNIHPTFGTELIQVVGGLSGVVSPDDSVYSVYFKNVYSGMQDYNETHQVRTPDYISSELYIAGANKDETFNLHTGLSYGLDLKTFLDDANNQKVACLVVASSGAALFHFFHWVYTDSSWTKPLAHARVMTSTLYFTTVNKDKTLNTKTLWTVVDDTPNFSHPSLSSWYLSLVDRSYAPAFMTQAREPLALGFGTGETIAAIEINGIVTITSNVDVPFSIGSGFYPDGAFVYDIKTGAAAVINNDYTIPGLVYEPVPGSTQGDLEFKDRRGISPAVGVFGSATIETLDFREKRRQLVSITNNTGIQDLPPQEPPIKLSLEVGTLSTTVMSASVPPTNIEYDITKTLFVSSGRDTNADYFPPKDGGAIIPAIVLPKPKPMPSPWPWDI